MAKVLGRRLSGAGKHQDYGQMRIIGGRLKGMGVNPPKGYKARPTTDFAKEGLFNVLGNEYEFADLKVLDLFGGTGSIGFEFAYRGGALVDTVEMNSANSSFISRSAASLGIASIVNVIHCNVFDFLNLCTRRYDIIFADPPYALEDLATLPDKVLSRDILFPGCYFILEHPQEYDYSNHPSFVKEKRYGNVNFSFFEKKI